MNENTEPRQPPGIKLLEISAARVFEGSCQLLSEIGGNLRITRRNRKDRSRNRGLFHGFNHRG
jgi:hypothetical protein